jgi:hypothetical protein
MKWALSYIVEPSYLKVMGIPLQRGRFLTSEDNEHSSPAIVIDDQFARRYFGDRDPVGRRINIDILNTAAEIVGVVGHVRQWGLDENAASPYLAQCYLSVFQIPDRFLSFADVARAVSQGAPSVHIVTDHRSDIGRIWHVALETGLLDRPRARVLPRSTATRASVAATGCPDLDRRHAHSAARLCAGRFAR